MSKITKVEMERQGYTNITDHEADVYACVGPKHFYKFKECAFNVAYGMKFLGVEPTMGSYQREFLYFNNMIMELAYKRRVQQGFLKDWDEMIFDTMSETKCIDNFVEAALQIYQDHDEDDFEPEDFTI